MCLIDRFIDCSLTSNK